jgi:FkbM family methyltransferase
MSLWGGLELPRDLLSRRLALLDVGARWGVQWPWDQLPADSVEITFVEPEPEEAVQLRQQIAARGSGRVLTTALWSEETTVQLHVNRSAGTSSVFAPNRRVLDQFPESDRFDTISTIPVSTKTVNGLAAERAWPHLDVAKIDVQGAELEIIKGGADCFARNLVALEVEVSFCELYSGQPLFADIDIAARALGLELWDLRKTYWKYERGRLVPGPQKGRLVFGDALYFRPITSLSQWLEQVGDGAANKVIMMVVTALAYGYADYATAVLSDLSIAKFVDKDARVRLQRAIDSVGSGLRIAGRGNRYVYWCFQLLAGASRPSHGGWAIPGSGLGSRRRGPFWS